MKSRLPEPFVARMDKLLGEEFDRFMASYDEPRIYGLRVNPLKISAGAWKKLSPIGSQTEPIPWAPDGFYYQKENRPAKHPHYYAGLYYIQEPSAMAPVELLDVQPGNRVLDLCAAPGGKSTQIAGKLQGKGVLVTNDISKDRTKALAKNVELAGVRNAVILNEDPARLASAFKGWFDRILVDAPCSGEGMFRKDETMVRAWESHSVQNCSLMQHDILRHVADMLAPGGKLVYSTCTFAPEENERQIARFLQDRPDFEVVPVEARFGWRQGRPDWIEEEETVTEADASWSEAVRSTSGTVRLWPHWIKGEGHYAAVLQRKPDTAVPLQSLAVPEEEDGAGRYTAKQRGGKGKMDKRAGSHGADEWLASKDRKDGGMPAKGNKLKRASIKEAEASPEEAWASFAEGQLQGNPAEDTRLITFGSRLFLQPLGVPDLDGLKVVRPGWFIGEADKGRFSPSQALALGLTMEDALLSLNLSSEDSQVVRYLKGETLFVDSSDLICKNGDEQQKTPKGYVLVCVDGYPLGWGMYADGTLKNKLPAGWRVL